MAVAVRARCRVVSEALEALDCPDTDGVDLILECVRQILDDVDMIEAGGEVIVPE